MDKMTPYSSARNVPGVAGDITNNTRDRRCYSCEDVDKTLLNRRRKHGSVPSLAGFSSYKRSSLVEDSSSNVSELRRLTESNLNISGFQKASVNHVKRSNSLPHASLRLRKISRSEEHLPSLSDRKNNVPERRIRKKSRSEEQLVILRCSKDISPSDPLSLPSKQYKNTARFSIREVNKGASPIRPVLSSSREDNAMPKSVLRKQYADKWCLISGKNQSKKKTISASKSADCLKEVDFKEEEFARLPSIFPSSAEFKEVLNELDPLEKRTLVKSKSLY